MFPRNVLPAVGPWSAQVFSSILFPMKVLAVQPVPNLIPTASRHNVCRYDVVRCPADGEIDRGNAADWIGGQGYDLHTAIDFESLKDYQPFREFVRPKG
jgi:hypothetical protein